MNINSLGHRAVLLLVPITLALALGCSHWIGLIGGDDLRYAVRAHRVWSERTPLAMTRLHDRRIGMYGLLELAFYFSASQKLSSGLSRFSVRLATSAAL